MKQIKILHLVTSGVDSGAQVLAVASELCVKYLDVGNVQLEAGAAQIHKDSGFLQRYVKAKRDGALVQIEFALDPAELKDSVLALSQGDFVFRFYPALKNLPTIDLKALAACGIVKPLPDELKHQEREIAAHWVVQLKRLYDFSNPRKVGRPRRVK
jgi:hypothetical protein